MWLIAIIVVGVLWYKYTKVMERVEMLERRNGLPPTLTPEPTVHTQTGANAFAPIPTPPNTTQAPTPIIPSPQTVPVPHVVALESDMSNDVAGDFIAWLKRDFLMKIGALFLLMAFGWFVSYAFANDWIGPAGRVSLGLLAGACIMILGERRIRTHEHQGAILVVLGSTIVLISVIAGKSPAYGLFSSGAALGLILLSVLFVTFVSLIYRRNSLALAGLILAALAPVFSGVYLDGLFLNMSYLLAIVGGTLWVVYATGWRNLTFTALCIVWLLTLKYLTPGDDQIPALLWSFLFTGIFFVANIISLIRQRGGITSITNLYTALGTALYLVMWVFGAAEQEFRSLLLVMWALVFGVGAYLVFRSTNVRSPFYVYGGTSIALLMAATFAELEGAVLAMTLAGEITALTLTASFLRMGRHVTDTLAMLFTVPIILTLKSITSVAWQSGVLHIDFFNLLILTLLLAITGLYLHEREAKMAPDEATAGTALIMVSAVYALILIWLVPHGALLNAEDLATAISLIVYTILGLWTYYRGRANDNQGLRVGGGILLACVIVHLLLFEVRAMDVTERIITFVVIGVLLLSTALMGRKKHTINQP